MNVLSNMLQTTRERGLFQKRDKLLISLSGGADSTALTRMLASIRAEYDLRLNALHLNYRLRNGESDKDETFVRDLCDSLSIPLAVRLPDMDVETARGESTQMTARRLRYSLLERERERTGADWIVTGHNRDDRVETVLLNLFRGAGTLGLASIPFRRGRVIRPLLDTTRAEIESFLSENGFPWRTDRTNRKTDYDRNKIRLEVIPFVEKLFGRPIGNVLARSADTAMDTDSFMEKTSAAWIGRLAERADGGDRTVPAAALAETDPAVARRVVRSMIRDCSGSLAGIRFDHVERILALAKGKGGGAVLLPHAFEACREGERIRFGSVGPGPEPFEISLSREECGLLPDGRSIRSHLLPLTGDISPSTGEGSRIARFDADTILPPLIVRSRLPGDRFRPLGAPGEKKVQDLLVDRKVPRSEREAIPLLIDREGILWVAGVEIAHRARITPETVRILEVAISPD